MGKRSKAERRTGMEKMGLESGLGRGSGGGSQHDGGCEALTLLQIMSSRWKVLDSGEVRRVVEEMKRRSENGTGGDGAGGGRICGCGIRPELRLKIQKNMIQTWGDNMGLLMRDLFGDEKRVKLEGMLEELGE